MPISFSGRELPDKTEWAAGIQNDQPVLITGAAGFIGFFLAEKLLRAGLRVVGIDNLNPYYDPKLKQARLDLLSQYPDFAFEKLDRGTVALPVGNQIVQRRAAIGSLDFDCNTPIRMVDLDTPPPGRRRFPGRRPARSVPHRAFL